MGYVSHLFDCSAALTSLEPANLWLNPKAAEPFFLNLLHSFGLMEDTAKVAKNINNNVGVTVN